MIFSRLPRIGIATLAATTLLSASAMANNQGQQRNAAEATSNGCSSYMKAPDGSWTPIPCSEAGASASAARRTNTRTTEKAD
ncbi:hypothetical protein [Rhodopseudomonas telluris]|uniref:Uncharacterized protein n=1 Tax=Rhodopseudomonas telluris TaxID=644215 RepID=A0ABV6ELT4_9BRAD